MLLTLNSGVDWLTSQPHWPFECYLVYTYADIKGYILISTLGWGNSYIGWPKLWMMTCGWLDRKKYFVTNLTYEIYWLTVTRERKHWKMSRYSKCLAVWQYRVIIIRFLGQPNKQEIRCLLGTMPGLRQTFGTNIFSGSGLLHIYRYYLIPTDSETSSQISVRFDAGNEKLI